MGRPTDMEILTLDHLRNTFDPFGKIWEFSYVLNSPDAYDRIAGYKIEHRESGLWGWVSKENPLPLEFIEILMERIKWKIGDHHTTLP